MYFFFMIVLIEYACNWLILTLILPFCASSYINNLITGGVSSIMKILTANMHVLQNVWVTIVRNIPHQAIWLISYRRSSSVCFCRNLPSCQSLAISPLQLEIACMSLIQPDSLLPDSYSDTTRMMLLLCCPCPSLLTVACLLTQVCQNYVYVSTTASALWRGADPYFYPLVAGITPPMVLFLHYCI